VGIPTETVKAWAAAEDCSPPVRAAINAELRRDRKGHPPRGLASPPPRRRGLVGGDKPVSVVVPIRVASTPNARVHRQQAARLVRHQRNLVALWLGRVVLPALPCRVVLTRIFAPRLKQQRIDSHDNYRAGLKAVVDEVAALYGVDDGRSGVIEWCYGEQEAGEAAGVRVEIVPERT
jgi:hypothetical protein